MSESSSEHLAPGTVLDERYEILRVLGEGGWATIYLARQIHVDRLVAIKLLSLVGSGEEKEKYRERFMAEARVAARVRHPNIVTIHDVGFLGPEKQPFIAMEYLEGRDLDQELMQGPIGIERTLRLLCPCLEALGTGHEAGVIHRDLKPANLFIVDPGTESERMVILDYGIARLTTRGARVTEEGSFFGTPAYLPPEWIKDQLATPSMDVYQMGLLVAECVTGQPAVDAESPYDCLTCHVNGELNIPEQLYDGPLGPVLRRALSRDHTQRYQNGSEFLDAIVEVIESSDLEVTNLWNARSWESLPRLGPVDQDTPSSLLTGRDPLVLQEPSAVIQPHAEEGRSRLFQVSALIAVLALLLIGAYWLVGEEDVSDDTSAHAMTRGSTDVTADGAEGVERERENAARPAANLPTPVPELETVAVQRISGRVLVSGSQTSLSGAARGAARGVQLDEEQKSDARTQRKKDRRSKKSDRKKSDRKKKGSMTVLP